MTISKSEVDAVASQRGQGYMEAVLGASIQDPENPDIFYIKGKDYTRIAAEFSELPPVKTQIRSAILALRKFAAAGLPTCPARKVAERKTICAGSAETAPCDWHRPSKIPLLSACGKCGCRGLKLYMETERCPIGKW